jgi:hypothetical protein
MNSFLFKIHKWVIEEHDPLSRIIGEAWDGAMLLYYIRLDDSENIGAISTNTRKIALLV